MGKHNTWSDMIWIASILLGLAVCSVVEKKLPHAKQEGFAFAPIDDCLAGPIALNMLESVRYQFHFGEAGSISKETFIVTNTIPKRLTVLDCFCGGDQFELYDNGVKLADIKTGCQNALANCNPNTYSNDYDTCLLNNIGSYTDLWCRQEDPLGVLLNPGSHNLTIKATVSFFRYGAGFIVLSNDVPDK